MNKYFHIVCTDGIDCFEKMVNEHIDKGWELHGDMIINWREGLGFVYYQAMKKIPVRMEFK